tara:strand:+ start:8135 stop:8302 length:168 start_codon:yes stop_codon:yes gene_type:complete
MRRIADIKVEERSFLVMMKYPSEWLNFLITAKYDWVDLKGLSKRMSFIGGAHRDH